MRLLTLNDNNELILTKDLTNNIPHYAILSHTWGSEDQEVSFKDILEGTGNSKDGYKKIQFCGKQAASHGLQYFWVDSCCIDKSNSTELSQAINSMFRWYFNAARCYVYLSDVSTGVYQSNNLLPWELGFRKSRWFTRGWTLQELIAPSSVEFFSVEGQRLGDKGSLERELHGITGIATAALRGSPLSNFSRRERMSWAEGRTTKIDEDKAYCLLGIFQVHLPLIYGEGVKHAFRRLEEEIDKQAAFEHGQLSDSQSLKPNLLPAVPVSFREAEEPCLRSLRFPSMNTRRLNIEKPAEQTCLWLFEHEAYRDWFLSRNRDKHGGLLWLKGKPGAGKSVLMKEAFRRAVQGQDKSDYRTAAFFFNAKGSELDRSPLGLFRSLLYQLLQKDPEHLQHFRELWDAIFYEENDPWREGELQYFFESMFSRQGAKRTIIFVDALDECGSESIQSQATFWRKITRSACNANIHLNVCLSMRDFPTITVSDCYEVLVQNYNIHDITTYLNQRFMLSIADKESQWELLKENILLKSAGVFLWVVLVVDDVLNKWNDGKSVQYLLKRLDVLPQELHDLFSEMFSSIDPSTRALTIRVFQWAILAVKPLRLHEWHHIIAFSRKPRPKSLREWRESDNFTHNDDQLEKQIRSISKGLIELSARKEEVKDASLEAISVRAGAGSLDVEYGEARVVQIIHESVREFFLQGDGFRAVDPNFKYEPIGYGHGLIMITCLAYIHIRELDALVEARNLVRQRKGDGSIKSPSETSFYESPLASAQIGSNVSGYPKAIDDGSGVSIDGGCDARRRYHERKQRGTESASVFEILKKSSDSSHIDMVRWLETLPRDECVTDLTSPNATACISPTALSTTGQSQVLEDYPALLSYATFEFFTHAHLALENGIDIRFVMGGPVWARWLALSEDLPHLDAPQEPELEPDPETEPGRPTYKSKQVFKSGRARRRNSVASFSSAGSHKGY
ncbi:hypothetical protein F5Y10DRAFT_245888 [Nemania abortiva]|nr:hypothetical protein F5Y10DRAFT_245888 [Nemania abortiva]